MKIDWTEVNEALDKLCIKHHGAVIMCSIQKKIEFLRELEKKG